MANINESLYVEEWLYNRLSTDATIIASLVGGRVHRGIPVQDQNDNPDSLLPLIRLYFVSGRDVQTINKTRIWAEMIYRIEVVARSESAYIFKSIVDRIDVLLHKSSGSVSGCNILSCTREGTISREDEEHAEKYIFVGGEYLIKAQAT